MGEADNAGDDIDKASEQAENLPGALAVGIIGCIIGLGVGIFYMLALRKLVKDLLGTVRSPCFCVPYEMKSQSNHIPPRHLPRYPPQLRNTRCTRRRSSKSITWRPPLRDRRSPHSVMSACPLRRRWFPQKETLAKKRNDRTTCTSARVGDKRPRMRLEPNVLHHSCIQLTGSPCRPTLST